MDKTVIIQDKRYRYDSENHLIQTTTYKDRGGIKTEDAQYNVFGELTQKGIDGVYNIHVDYDVLGRVRRSNTAGYYQIFAYDLMDHVTQVVTSTSNFRGNYRNKGIDLSQARFDEDLAYNRNRLLYDLQRQDNMYDARGHLLAQTKEFTVDTKDVSGDVHLERATQTQTVDRWGNMLTFTSACGHDTRYEYNALNQVIKQEMPEVTVMDEHGVTSRIKPIQYYAYDELGRSIAMTDANGHTVSKSYDAMGHVIRETDAKGYSREKDYNLLNQLTSATNELKGVTSYTYDAANRLVLVSTSTTSQRYDYDELGQLILQTDGRRDATQYWYDSLGNQVKRRDARGYDTVYDYDDSGHKTRETDANGHNQTWVYDESGRLVKHSDLGGHVTDYEYNSNGLLITESSTSGKHIEYSYRGDGELIEYLDKTYQEVMRYTYDVEGHVTSKESSKAGDYKDGWLRETDYYQYDELGRLAQVRRRNPNDVDKQYPDKDHSLLSIDYDYDKVGNIRHTKVSANYANYPKSYNEDYYVYDENNRMTVNKGQLLNGQIGITASQGSTLAYDASGNIATAIKYENNAQQTYSYRYTADNQVDVIKKNGNMIQSKFYDAAGHVETENTFDEYGHLSQTNTMTTIEGILRAQTSRNQWGVEVSKTLYDYDKVGNMEALTINMYTSSGAGL